MCVFMCVCVYLCVGWGGKGAVWYVYTDTHTQTHRYTDAHMYTDTHRSTQLYTDIQRYIDISRDTEIHRFTHTHTHVHTHTVWALCVSACIWGCTNVQRFTSPPPPHTNVTTDTRTPLTPDKHTRLLPLSPLSTHTRKNREQTHTTHRDNNLSYLASTCLWLSTSLFECRLLQ